MESEGAEAPRPARQPNMSRPSDSGSSAASVPDVGATARDYPLFRRRRYLVAKRLQLTVMGWVLFEVAAAVAVTIGAVLLPLVREVREGEARGAIDLKSAAALSTLHSGIWIAGLLALLTVALHSIKTSHRIAGPLYRFRTIYRAIAGGAAPESVRLRRNDLLHDDAADLNDALAAIRRRAEERGRAHALLRELRPLATAETAGRIDALLEPSRSPETAP